MESNQNGVLKQGWIEKRSRFLKEWRRRWMVLTSEAIFTYKTQHTSGGATERIVLRECSSVKSAQEQTKRANAFRIDTRGRVFYLIAENSSQKENWIGLIGRAMIKPTVMRTKSEEDALDRYQFVAKWVQRQEKCLKC